MVENSRELSQSWKCIQTITTNYSDSVAQIAFSPDGTTLASCSGQGGCIKLWNVASGQEIHTLSDDYVIGFSQDSKTLASRRFFWDVATGKAIHWIEKNFRNIGISPDFQTVASYQPNVQRGNQPDVTKLWDTATEREICTLPALVRRPFIPQELTKFSPNGKIFAQAINKIDDFPRHELKLWDVTTCREICTIADKGNSMECFCLTFSPDGQILASVWDIGIILLSDVATGKQLCLIKNGSKASFSLAFSPDGQILASGNEIGQIKLWQLNSSWFRPLTVIKKRTLSSALAKSVKTIAFSPNGQTLASGVGDCNSGITLWTVETGNKIKTIPGHTDSGFITGILISPDGQMVARYKLIENTIKLWNIQSGSFMYCLQSRGFIKAIAFSRDGKFLTCVATGLYSVLYITIWESTTGKKIANTSYKIDTEDGDFGANILGLSEDGVILAVCSQGGTLNLLESIRGKTICRIKIPDSKGLVRRVAFSRDRQFIAVTYLFGHIIDICVVQTGTVSCTINIHPQEFPKEIVFSSDGQILAIKDENIITLWQVSSGRRLHTFNCGFWGYALFSLAFSFDSQILASPTRKATIKLWNVATGDEICTLPGHSSPPPLWDNRGFSSSSIAFSCSELVLVSCGEDGTIKAWQKRSDELTNEQ